MNWTQATDDMIRKMFHDEGLSYRQIAMRFDGATIGKVAGRCRSLGLVRGTSRTLGRKKIDGRMQATRETEGIVRQHPPLRREPNKPGTVQLLDLDARACRWPCGEPGKPGFGFCGLTQIEGSSYCNEHHQRAHHPAVYRKLAAG